MHIREDNWAGKKPSFQIKISIRRISKGNQKFLQRVFTIHFSLSFFSRKTAAARFTANSLLQFLQEHFYGPIGSRVVTHYPIMGQGRGAHAQPAFFLAGLLFLPARLREVYDDVDAIIRCRGMRDPGIGGFWERILCRYVDLVHVSPRKNCEVS